MAVLPRWLLLALTGLLATRFRAAVTLAALFALYLVVTFATSWRGDQGTMVVVPVK